MKGEGGDERDENRDNMGVISNHVGSLLGEKQRFMAAGNDSKLALNIANLA